jgi:hypothetical protein
MQAFRTFASHLSSRPGAALGTISWIQRADRPTENAQRGRIRFASFRRWLQSGMLLPVLAAFFAAPQTLRADPPLPAISDPAPAAAKDDGQSFMGMRVGSFVRVNCTAPEIELNNARLVAVGDATITVASSTGERYILPRDSTVLSRPVNWRRTSGMMSPPTPRRKAPLGWTVWPLLLLVGAGAVILFWMGRRREAQVEGDGQPAAPTRTRRITAVTAPTGKGRLVLSAAPQPATSRFSLTAPPSAATPATSLERDSESESDGIEDLIETRRYGTAIERLEKQIKLQPDDFKPRLQLLKIYVIIDNHKQVDRVLHQIEFHRHFSAEQKLEARQCLPGTRGKLDKDKRPAPEAAASAVAPTAQSAAATATEVSSASPAATDAQPDSQPVAKPATRPAVKAPPMSYAEAAARFGLNPNAGPASGAATKPEAQKAKPEEQLAANSTVEPGSKPDAAPAAKSGAKPASKPSGKSRSRSRSKGKHAAPASSLVTPATAPAGTASGK